MCTRHVGILLCEECGTVSARGEHWRAYLTVEDEGSSDELAQAQVAVYCPRCAEEEFGAGEPAT